MNISATFSVGYFLNEVIFEMFGRFLPNNAVKNYIRRVRLQRSFSQGGLDYRQVYLFAKTRLSFFSDYSQFLFQRGFLQTGFSVFLFVKLEQIIERRLMGRFRLQTVLFIRKTEVKGLVIELFLSYKFIRQKSYFCEYFFIDAIKHL